MSRNKALMATALIEDLTRLVEQHGDLPVLVGYGHTLETPQKPRVTRVVREDRVKTRFTCHQPLLTDPDTIPAIHLG